MAAAFKSREEHRRQQELEEARKAGLAPAEVDEDGKEINPHIPQFMASAPWYLNQGKPGLKHQKAWKPGDLGSTAWYKRGEKTFQATKYRKGACENCGAMTHKSKDCVERPRKKGAKITNMNIAADELIQEVELNFDGKRDRYNGFDPADYAKVVDRYNAAEERKAEVTKQKELERAYRKAQRKKGDVADEDEEDDEDDSEDDNDEKLAERHEAGFMEVKKRVRTAGGGASLTVRNLRIREDTAKYLKNLDLSSAYYDPKTRSMREDPTPNGDPSEKFFHGDNAKRKTGDTLGFEHLNKHAWEAYQKGQEIHMQAAPSQAEMLYNQYKVKKEALTGNSKSDILSKYGDASSKEAPPEGLILGQTEQYVEYDRAGRVIKGAEKLVVKSRFEEDVHINNHTAVWGSFWQAGQWGYACCRSLTKNSYCTGLRGIEASDAAADLMKQNMADKEKRDAAKKQEQEAEEAAAAAAAAANGKKASSSSAFERKKEVWGGDVPEDVTLDPKKLREALRKEEEAKKEGEKDDGDERKRAYNVTYDADVTEEEMEAYRMKKQRMDDPMNNPGMNGGGGSGTDGYDLV